MLHDILVRRLPSWRKVLPPTQAVGDILSPWAAWAMELGFPRPRCVMMVVKWRLIASYVGIEKGHISH